LFVKKPSKDKEGQVRLYTSATKNTVIGCVLLAFTGIAMAQTDPGPRAGAAGAGAAIAGLTIKEAKFFDGGLDSFTEIASVSGSVPGTEEGLGPRFNLDSCAGCHKHPAVGGTSPAINPQVNPALSSAAQVSYVTSTVPILSLNGPVREVRFSTDGGVHDLFTVVGRPDAPAGCTILQPDFVAANAAGILRFRIPTPTFGLGLIEAIEDATILANLGPKPFGISGSVNRNGNDGTVTRFGWKAQNKSLVIFSGEAYNVEQGITNELFPDERGEGGVPDPIACRQVVTAPQDTVHYDQTQPQKVTDDASNFANFMRFIAAPTPVSSYGSVTNAQITAGEAAFNKAGCNVCHTKSMVTGNHANAALRFKTANLFSDILVHDIGTGDGISQGLADGTQFRTAPLWGVGQRLFFLHDGRTNNIVTAITTHAGEATQVIENFNGTSILNPANNLSATERQNLVYFLRSL
jgi:CxxC motif-containing protein (DUF1111 family)